MAALPQKLHDHLLHPSGGLIYHLRALRHRHGLWRDFHAAVGVWLEAWHPQRTRLVIVGPNAGHALPAGFLTRFREVVALEPDLIARLWLKRRNDADGLRFDSLDCLGRPDGLAWLAARYPDAAVLFSNVLGQVDAPEQDWTALLSRHLHAQPWASYHDVASTARAPGHTNPFTPARAVSLEQALAHFWTDRELHVTDHETFQLGGKGPFAYVPWQITPKRWQLVEWVVSPPTKTAGQA